MNLTNKKIIMLLVTGLIVLVIGIFGFIYTQNQKNSFNTIKNNIVSNKQTDTEVDYLLKNKYISDEEVKKLDDIYSNIENLSSVNKTNINKLKEAEIEFKSIEKVVKQKLNSNIINSKEKQLKLIKNLEPVNEEEKEFKEQYLKILNKNNSADKISDLIKIDSELSANNKNIKTLKNKISFSKEKELFNNRVKVITKEQIAEVGISNQELDKDGNYSHYENTKPKLCSLTDAKESRIKEYDSANIVDKIIYEHHHISNYYLTMYNSKYDGITTLTDTNINKTYLVYNGSISGANCPEKSTGGATTIVLYDFITKEIKSITTTQNFTYFIMNKQVLSFILDNDNTLYIEDIGK